jgi:hypothetical protein
VLGDSQAVGIAVVHTVAKDDLDHPKLVRVETSNGQSEARLRIHGAFRGLRLRVSVAREAIVI